MNNYSITKFTRKIKLCNNLGGEDLDIEQGTPHVIFAWGTKKPESDISYHDTTNRGSQVIPLISSLNLKVDLNINQLETKEYRVNV